MTMRIPHTDISDFSGCSRCVADGKAGYAHGYFNADHVLWAVCETHGVRWHVTRVLLGIDEDPGALQQYAEVDAVYRMSSMAP